MIGIKHTKVINSAIYATNHFGDISFAAAAVSARSGTTWMIMREILPVATTSHLLLQYDQQPFPGSQRDLAIHLSTRTIKQRRHQHLTIATSMRKFLLAAALTTASLLQAQIPAALTTDPPADQAHPASMDAFQIPSHDGRLNATAYIASGAGPHPAVILLHGFPGNEKNLDLAQSIRRAGWTVLWFNYRGSWGAPGTFSFSHAIEDTETAIAWLRSPANAARLRVDPTRIVLAGHSMGGMVSSIVGASDAKLLGVGLISAADMVTAYRPQEPVADPKVLVAKVAANLEEEGLYPLAGCTGESLAQELIANTATWSVLAQASGLSKHPLLVISANDDLAPATDKLLEKVRATPDAKPVVARHFQTDHSYSDHRIAMEVIFLNWLSTLPRR